MFFSLSQKGYQCDDNNSNDWIDDPTVINQPAKPGDCQGVCEHTSKRGAVRIQIILFLILFVFLTYFLL